MGMTRRQAVLASLTALTFAGCRSTRSMSRGSSGSTGRVGPDWGNYPARPTGPAYSGTVVAPPAASRVVEAPAAAAGSTSTAAVPAMARRSWTTATPIAAKVNPMNGISKITVHHEGWHAVWFSDRQQTAARIEQIRNVHVRDRGWGDIGYHYIVDRAGTVWEGRPIQYQGAHVSEHNEHNVGILILGNFDKQSPSDAQYRAVLDTVKRLKTANRVDVRNVRSHQEINPTQCPGANMQNKMDALRRSV